MRIVEIVRKVLEAMPLIVDYILVFLTVIVAAYGAVKAYLEVPDVVRDLWDRLRDKDFRVKTTVLKAIIAENQTQIIKLRDVRVHKEREKLELDPTPVCGPGPVCKDQPVDATHYSVPGRSFVVPRQGVNKFQIDFLPDEYLSPHHDHPILLSYSMNAKLSKLFDPPAIVAIQPVGSERLTIEVYFPPTWHLKKGTSKVRTIDDEGNPIETLAGKRAQVVEYNYDFDDGGGPVDFIRAVITKPQQTKNIELCWEWERSTENSIVVPQVQASNQPAQKATI